MKETKLLGMPAVEAFEICLMMIIIAIMLGEVFNEKYLQVVVVFLLGCALREIYIYKFRRDD